MRISKVSKKVGVKSSAIRYYENLGLIKSQSRVSGRREFDASSVQLLKFIKLAKSVGFSLKEVKQLVDDIRQDENQAGKGCNSLAAAKQLSIREQIKRLQEMDKMISVLQDCKCNSLQECVNHSIDNLEKYSKS